MTVIILLPFLLLWWLAWIVVFTWAGYTIGKPKGLSTEGLVLGFFIGIFGVLVVYMLPAKVQAVPVWNPQAWEQAPQQR